jgi:hypothetical protein
VLSDDATTISGGLAQLLICQSSCLSIRIISMHSNIGLHIVLFSVGALIGIVLVVTYLRGYPG